MRWMILTLVLTGCGYAGALRSTAVDVLDRRAERVLAASTAVARTLLVDNPTELPGPDEPVELIDFSTLDQGDMEAIARRMYKAVASVVQDAERSRAWLACMREDLGAPDDAIRPELDTDDEHTVYVRYAGVSGARAWRLKQWRTVVSFARGVQRFARRTYAVTKWVLYAAVAALAIFGGWQLWKQRRATKGVSEGVQALASMRDDGTSIAEATAGKPALKRGYELERKKAG